jgi:hypothetical protein
LVIPVDARVFWDPAGNTNHIGLHRDVIHGVVTHRMFATWLSGVVRHIATAVQEAVSRGASSTGLKCTVAVYCKSGRHRSVAAAHLVAACIAAVGSPRLKLVLGSCIDLHNAFWGHKLCNGCEECHRLDTQKLADQNYARTKWVAAWEALLGARLFE